MNTFSQVTLSRFAYIGAASRPIATAPAREMITQTIAMAVAFGKSRTDLIPMKRTRICGWPKYPKPHAASEKTASNAAPVLSAGGNAESVTFLTSYALATLPGSSVLIATSGNTTIAKNISAP